MDIPVIKGFLYAVTAGTESVELTDENGLTISVGSGEQSMFTATCDKVTVTGDATVTQVR